MSAAETKKRICIIGCGPSGMSALYHFSKLSDDDIPELVCYEKQETWGGLWNRTWRTGDYAPNFENMGTYWFGLVRMYVCMYVCIYVSIFMCGFLME